MICRILPSPLLSYSVHLQVGLCQRDFFEAPIETPIVRTPTRPALTVRRVEVRVGRVLAARLGDLAREGFAPRDLCARFGPPRALLGPHEYNHLGASNHIPPNGFFEEVSGLFWTFLDFFKKNHLGGHVRGA
jgi:hypothetical protein